MTGTSEPIFFFSAFGTLTRLSDRRIISERPYIAYLLLLSWVHVLEVVGDYALIEGARRARGASGR